MAFQYEVAKTRSVVSDTTIGLIRLQWWRDGIAKIYAGKPPRQHQILAALVQIIQEHDLPQDWFDTLIYAREFDLEGVAPINMAGLTTYCDYTGTPFLKLCLKIVGEEAKEESVQQAAVNYGLVGLMRTLPVMAQEGQCFIPQDMLKEHDIAPEQLLHHHKGWPPMVEEILAHCDFTRKPESRFLRRTQTMARLYADQIKNSNYIVTAPNLSIPPKFMPLRILIA